MAAADGDASNESSGDASSGPDGDSDTGTCAGGSGLACPLPVSACSQNCPLPTWTAVLEGCERGMPSATGALAMGLLTCGQVDAVSIQFIDRGETDYYDHATGALVAETGYVDNETACAYGPSCFLPPSDCADLPPCAPDAAGGTDANAVSDGGVDAM